MRLAFKFINDKYSRPLCLCNINGHKLRCLFDTGAGVNVVCVGSLVSLFRNNCRYLKMDNLGGFGGLKQQKPVYVFDDFNIGTDKSNFLTYTKLVSFLDDKPELGCDIVLSTSMFTECVLTVDYLDRYVYIDSRKTSYTFGVINDVPYVCSIT